MSSETRLDTRERAEFLVSESLSTPEGFIVRGVCNRGRVAIGDVFDEVIRESAGNASEAVDLRVVAIVAYRRPIEEVPEGLSAELHCKGVAANGLRPNDMLIGANDRTAS